MSQAGTDLQNVIGRIYFGGVGDAFQNPQIGQEILAPLFARLQPAFFEGGFYAQRILSKM